MLEMQTLLLYRQKSDDYTTLEHHFLQVPHKERLLPFQSLHRRTAHRDVLSSEEPVRSHHDCKEPRKYDEGL